ncbi:MAG: PEP/pyruvate-binding domain-containing protein [Myxococcales bacterium]
MRSLSLVLPLLLLALGCSTGPGAVDAGVDGGGGALDAAANPDAGAAPDSGTATAPSGYLTRLETAADMAALAAGDGEIKYLAPVEGKERRAPLTADCYFQDMHQYSWHVLFLKSFPELGSIDLDTYLAMVMRRPSRSLWGGAVKAWPAVKHPITKAEGIVAYTVYTNNDAASALVENDIVEVDARLKACAPFAAAMLVFVPGDASQESLAHRIAPSLEARGIATVFPKDLLAGIPSVVYNPGEGYGLLRRVPAGQPLVDYGPRDVVVVESAPNDISLVSGLVTANPQNEFSHVNLRLREKRVPNAAVPSIYENALVTQLAGTLVHVVAGDSKVVIEAARLEDAEAFWKQQRPPLGAAPADLTVQALRPMSELTHEDAKSVGVKAANLAEIRKALPDNSQDGFAIPFARYAAFATAAGIDEAVDAALADPRLRTDATFKAATLSALRKRVKSAPLPAGLLDEVATQIRAMLGAGADTTYVRLRSSTNAEDLEAFSGAGLYDSKTGCLADDLDADTAGPSACLTAEHAQHLRDQIAARQAELAAHPERTWIPDILDDLQGDLDSEKPLADALRKVWASLWNDRAFDEREYYGIDHRTVYMGVAVAASYVMEKANAVAVTNLAPDSSDPLYRVVSQPGEESVVRPADPLAVAEVVTFRRHGDPAAMAEVQVLVPASMVPTGQQVWSTEAQATLGGALFTLQDYFAQNVYPDRTPLRLDVEVKWNRDGRVLVKQARPYWTKDP